MALTIPKARRYCVVAGLHEEEFPPFAIVSETLALSKPRRRQRSGFATARVDSAANRSPAALDETLRGGPTREI